MLGEGVVAAFVEDLTPGTKWKEFLGYQFFAEWGGGVAEDPDVQVGEGVSDALAVGAAA